MLITIDTEDLSDIVEKALNNKEDSFYTIFQNEVAATEHWMLLAPESIKLELISNCYDRDFLNIPRKNFEIGLKRNLEKVLEEYNRGYYNA